MLTILPVHHGEQEILARRCFHFKSLHQHLPLLIRFLDFWLSVFHLLWSNQVSLVADGQHVGDVDCGEVRYCLSP